jgi:hypothetical protein
MALDISPLERASCFTTPSNREKACKVQRWIWLRVEVEKRTGYKG